MITDPMIVPAALMNFSRLICNVSDILSRAFVTRLKISPDFFLSKNDNDKTFNFLLTRTHMERASFSAAFAMRSDYR